LYALIGDAKYPLRHAGGDVFTDRSGRRVAFQRERVVTGYTLSDTGAQVYRRLSKDVRFPAAMWYPRPPADGPGYTYAPPRDLGDGLKVGSLRNSSSGLDMRRIEEMVRLIIQGQYPDVHSVLIVDKGTLVLEEYFYEYEADTVHPLRSATKSFIATLMGLAIEDGLIASVRQPVLPYFEKDYREIANLTERKRRITIEDLLTQRSGLDCDDWNPNSPGHEVRMGRTEDWVKFFLDLPMLHEPGTVASYCSAGVIALGRMVEKASGQKLDEFARERLFGPLGVQRLDWRFVPDNSSSHTFCQLSLRPRDMAKFGLTFLRGGAWNGRTVVPASWVKASLAKHSFLDDTDYGYLWWRPYLDVSGRRHHAFLATGNGGQKIYLWPELDLVVVLTGGAYNVPTATKEILVRHVLPGPPQAVSREEAGASAPGPRPQSGPPILVRLS
jgi:CubicO group peptidase (beta-lactamase class C family)